MSDEKKSGDNRADSRAVGVHKPATHPVPRLPADEFAALRRLKERPNINDQVEGYYLKLIEDEEFLGFIDAVHDEQAIEGSLSADNLMASKRIRDAAEEVKDEAVGKLKLATIGKALNIVQKRYGMGRKQRRYTVGGEVVPPDGSNGSGSTE